MPRAVWSHNTTISRATNFTPFRLMYGAEAVLPEEVKHQSLRIAAEVPACPSEAEKRIYWSSIGSWSWPICISIRNKGMERPEGQAPGTRCRRLGSLAKPTHRGLQKTRIQMGWAIRDRRKAKTGGILPLGFSGQDVGAFLERRRPPPIFHLIFFVSCECLVGCK
jgi:hypothetical protein